MGFFSGLGQEDYDRQYQDKVLIKRISAYFKPFIRNIVFIMGMILVISAGSALQPILISNALDKMNETPGMEIIIYLTSIILFIGVFIWFANFIRRRITVKTIADVILNLSKDAYQASVYHDLSFYDRISSGRIVSRITSDTRDFGQMVVFLTDLISQIFELLLLSVVLIRIEWRLFLYVLAFVPFVFLIAIMYRKAARRVTRQGMQAMAEVNSTIKETVSGISVAKNFRQEASIFEDFKEANLLSYKVNVNRGLVLSIVFPTLSGIMGIATAIIVYAGGMTVAQGIISAGAWYLFLLSVDRFMFPIMNLASFWTQIQSGLSASERVFGLIDAESSVSQLANHPISSIEGVIEFKDVDFYYKSEEMVLDKFNLKISKGENLAIVGHTGAGKSSIAKIIARYYEFQKGTIEIDGKDIRSINLERYRNQIGIVSQTPFLFSGTILENIRYAAKGITTNEILTVSNSIGNGDWLDSLPNGLQTEVGERGALLSMGQRQLIALMRVLVQKPGIFILDEATASIDPFTEKQIQASIDLILSNSTSILIAHRLSTIKSADRIIVLEEGKIVEEGNHLKLLGKNGLYSNLYNSYFRHQSLEYVEEAGKYREFSSK
ncbi:MAG: ABC transporter ATP-binding protein [Bacteroidales bacterium]|nr:ABC transporter ATP-binding protein [Bacteroidales bacterium]